MTTSHLAPSLRRSLVSKIAANWTIPAVVGSILAGGILFFVRPEAGSEMEQSALPAKLEPAPIDGNRAYGYLKTLCAIGPRKAGSAANAKQRKLVADHFTKLGLTVREQKFRGVDYFDRRKPKQVDMINLIASFNPEKTDRIVLAAHYDTRPFPDMEPDPEKRRAPFLGANDGASGVALLMEIANHLDKMTLNVGVDLLLLDGEELIYEYDDGDRRGEFFLGSKFFAKQYKAERKTGKNRYVAGIVLDMIADRELTIPQEPLSLKLAGGLVREMWAVAEKLDARAFRFEVGREVLDDHLPMNDAGIPTIDIIDFDYPFWHTANDVPEECSAESLEQVGRVVTAWLSIPKKLRK